MVLRKTTMAEAGIPEGVPATATAMGRLYTKPTHFAEEDVVPYSKKEVVNCLFFNMPTVYPENDFEPLTMGRVYSAFRSYLTLVILKDCNLNIRQTCGLSTCQRRMEASQKRETGSRCS